MSRNISRLFTIVGLLMIFGGIIVAAAHWYTSASLVAFIVYFGVALMVLGYVIAAIRFTILGHPDMIWRLLFSAVYFKYLFGPDIEDIHK